MKNNADFVNALIAAKNNGWIFRGYQRIDIDDLPDLYWFHDTVTKSTHAIETLSFGAVMSAIYSTRDKFTYLVP